MAFDPAAKAKKELKAGIPTMNLLTLCYMTQREYPPPVGVWFPVGLPKVPRAGLIGILLDPKHYG